VFVLMSIHHPKPGYEAALIDSMHRYASAIRGKPGIRSIHTLKDRDSSRLIGLAIFESEADFLALSPTARAAVEHDPFEVWEELEIEGLKLEEA
jgi:heme-degrading monooxygenase HmoA